MNENEKIDPCCDPDRAAYMIAWRDRYIERLQERLAGREEENDMLSTLLFGTLFHKAKICENGERRVRIPVKVIAELLGRWRCHTESDGENYAVCFTPRTLEGVNDAAKGSGA